jgi:uncharacterized MnhB-related membrane protein
MEHSTHSNKLTILFAVSMICIMGYFVIQFFLTIKVIKGKDITQKETLYATVIGGILGALICLIFGSTLLFITPDNSMFDWKEFVYVVLPVAVVIGLFSGLSMFWRIKREQRRWSKRRKTGLIQKLLALLMKAVKKHVEREE